MTGRDCLAMVREAIEALSDDQVRTIVETVVGGFIYGVIDEIHSHRDEICDGVVENIVSQIAAAAQHAQLGDIARAASEIAAPASESDAAPEPSPEPYVAITPAKQGGIASSAVQDAVKRTCVVCGRVGSRRFIETALGWRCSPSATKCPGNRTFPPPKVTVKTPPPSTSTVRVLDEIAAPVAERIIETPAPADTQAEVEQLAHAIAENHVTARCTDCPQTWKLTGRVLRMAVDTHEMRRGHIVDVLETTDE
ncbi:hypothetical protein [Mycolicibacterium llatzerense]|uniref:hypothetical protein n=1 Tax=Mycolicibacterium llatzerense TaxID=280871 RepID=UPI0021B6A908|nr:hypothetical protein [Mycolicibacterium llatzerense]MCT7369429.1 hypothetical protein [Mycolicibacterium llatzerense]